MNNFTFGKLAWWITCAAATLFALDLWTEYATHRWHLDSGHAHLIFQFDTLAGQAVLVALGVALAWNFDWVWRRTPIAAPLNIEPVVLPNTGPVEKPYIFVLGTRAIRGWVERQWRGELPLWLSYWVIPTLSTLLIGLFSLTLAAIIAGGLDGLNTDDGLYFCLLFFFPLWSVAFIWSIVGIWRSAGRSIKERHAKGMRAPWAILARVAVVVSGVGVVAGGAINVVVWANKSAVTTDRFAKYEKPHWRGTQELTMAEIEAVLQTKNAPAWVKDPYANPVNVRGPDGSITSFPAGMTNIQIKEAMHQKFPPPSECATAKNSDECFEILRKLREAGKTETTNPFAAFDFVYP